METKEQPLTAVELLKQLQPLQLVVTGLTSKLEEARRLVDDLEVEYTEVAKRLAAGATDADPVAVQERQRRQLALIQGTEQLLVQAKAKVQPVQEAYNRARREENLAAESADVDRCCAENTTRGLAFVETEIEARQEFDAIVRNLQDKAKTHFVNPQNKSRISQTIEHLVRERDKRLANL